MRRQTLILMVFLLLAVVTSSAVSAQARYEFRLGFKALADQIPAVVGQPLENEHWGANGDSLQQTSRGLMAWRKLDNWTAFTDGASTWINGPSGVQSRPNGLRFQWEADASDRTLELSPVKIAPGPAPTRAPVPAPPPPAPTTPRAPTAVPAPVAQTLPPDVVSAAEEMRGLITEWINQGIVPTDRLLKLAIPELSGNGVGDETELARERSWLASLDVNVGPTWALPKSAVAESRIDGDFKGWSGSTVFQLVNGQVWQQSAPARNGHWAYSPRVVIYATVYGYKMKVEGVDATIYVKRIR